MCMFAAWFSERKDPSLYADKREKLVAAIQELPDKVTDFIRTNKYAIQEIAKEIIGCKYMAILGKGLSEVIAKEAALKVKELTYVTSDGGSSSEYRHGPLAQVSSDGTSVVVIYILDDKYFDTNISILETTKSKGAYTVVITD